MLIAAVRRCMDCSEFITSEDYMDYIAQNIRVPSEILCRVNVDENWSIVYGKMPAELNMNIGSLEYRTIPKLYGLMDTEVLREQVAGATMSDTSAYDSSGITALLNQPTLDVRGQGVLIGIIDTGECVIIMLRLYFVLIRTIVIVQSIIDIYF